ncbi:hypothetical protein ABPG77_004374 [Micractinium sp. CCAP 211/92]
MATAHAEKYCRALALRVTWLIAALLQGLSYAAADNLLDTTSLQGTPGEALVSGALFQGAVYKTGPNPLGYNINRFYIHARNSLACSPCTVLLKITKVSASLAPDESFVHSTGVTASFPPTSGLVYLPSPIGSMPANTYWTLLFSTSGPQFAWSYVQNGTAPDGPEISDTGWTLAGLSQFDFSLGSTLAGLFLRRTSARP